MKKKRGALPKDHGLCEKEQGERRKFFSQEMFVLLDLPADG